MLPHCLHSENFMDKDNIKYKDSIMDKDKRNNPTTGITSIRRKIFTICEFRSHLVLPLGKLPQNENWVLNA